MTKRNIQQSTYDPAARRLGERSPTAAAISCSADRASAAQPLVLTTASKLLRSIGYDVVTAGDGQEAIKQFQAHRSQLVAVVCDAVMPREAGLEVLRRISEAAPSLAGKARSQS